MRVYFHPNIDGKHQAMVAAESQKEACKLLGCTENDFRKQGGKRLYPENEEARIALPFPGLVHLRQHWNYPWQIIGWRRIEPLATS